MRTPTISCLKVLATGEVVEYHKRHVEITSIVDSHPSCIVILKK